MPKIWQSEGTPASRLREISICNCKQELRSSATKRLRAKRRRRARDISRKRLCSCILPLRGALHLEGREFLIPVVWRRWSSRGDSRNPPHVYMYRGRREDGKADHSQSDRRDGCNLLVVSGLRFGLDLWSWSRHPCRQSPLSRNAARAERGSQPASARERERPAYPARTLPPSTARHTRIHLTHLLPDIIPIPIARRAACLALLAAHYSTHSPSSLTPRESSCRFYRASPVSTRIHCELGPSLSRLPQSRLSPLLPSRLPIVTFLRQD